MKKISIFFVSLGVILVAGCGSKPVSTSQTPTTPSMVTNQATGSEQVKTYSLQDVVQHSTAESCRSIVKDKVYDFTFWVSLHPGGAENIVSMCGKDSTQVFEKIHGGKEKPEMKLNDYYIGEFK